MYIKATFQSMSIFLGVFSTLVLFSVVLYDEYGGNVIISQNASNANQSNADNQQPKPPFENLPPDEIEYICTMTFKSDEVSKVKQQIENYLSKHSECIHRGIGLQLINVVFPQNIMSHHWLNVSAPIIDLRIYSYNRLIITPNFFENTMFEELSSLILSNVKIIDENGVQLQLPAASNDATAVNGTKFKFLGICSNIRGTLDARQVQDLLNHDSITAMGNMILEPLENIYIRHDNLKNTIYRATFVNVESGKNVRLPNHYIRYNWPDVFYFVTSDIKAIDLSPNRMWRVTSEHFASLLHKRTQMMLLFDGHPRLCNCSAIPVGFDRPQQRPSKCIEYGGIVSMAEASIPIDEQLSTAVAAKPSNALSLTVATSFEPASKPPTSVGRVEDRLEDELDDEEEPLADQRQETEARSQQDRLRHQRFTNSKSKYDEIFDHDRIENRYKQRFGPLTENYDDSKADPREAIRQDDSNTVEIECVDYDNPRNTETIRVQCRDYLMQITEVDSTTLRVELEESLPNYVLIWFNDSMVTVLDHETTEDDISCMSDVNTTNVIKNLEAGLTYTFCILEKTSITISPFNCAAFYLAHKETSPFWISADKKSLAIGIAVALFVFFTWLGLVFGILLVRRNPTWLKGTKRVVVVNNRDNCPEITSTGSMDLSLEDNNAVENPDQGIRKISLGSAKSFKVGYEMALHHTHFDIIKSKLDAAYVEKGNKYFMDKIPNLQAPIPPELDDAEGVRYGELGKKKEHTRCEEKVEKTLEVDYEKY